MQKAIFLDRDGTINEDIGYFCDPDRLEFIPRAFEALRLLQQSFVLFIVTNQSGVARKYFSEDDLVTFNKYIQDELKKQGIHIRQTYYCPHLREDNCECHKPNDFFLKAAEESYGLDLKGSYVIGDHPHDIELAHNVGAGSVYVLTGHGKKHFEEITAQPDHVAPTIYEAARWIDQYKDE